MDWAVVDLIPLTLGTDQGQAVVGLVMRLVFLSMCEIRFIAQWACVARCVAEYAHLQEERRR
jgi:hypothetical protein